MTRLCDTKTLYYPFGKQEDYLKMNEMTSYMKKY